MTPWPQNEQPLDSTPGDLLKAARKAAENKQPDGMIEALTISGFLDGLVGQLSYKWDALPRFEIEECVAQAVDSAYAAISNGRRVANLGGWLWKVAYNKASDCWHQDYAQRTSSDFKRLPDADRLSDTERARLEELQDRKRREAIRLARELLPRIGHGQIIDVMEIVIDAVEKGIPDIPPTEIGAALGISPDAARTLLSRGYSRLEREARREGIEFPDHLSSDAYEDNASFPETTE